MFLKLRGKCMPRLANRCSLAGPHPSPRCLSRLEYDAEMDSVSGITQCPHPTPLGPVQFPAPFILGLANGLGWPTGFRWK